MELTQVIERVLGEEVACLGDPAVQKEVQKDDEAAGTAVELADQGLAALAPGVEATVGEEQRESKVSVTGDAARILSEMCLNQLSRGAHDVDEHLKSRVSAGGQGAGQGFDEEFVHEGGDLV